MQDIKTAQRMGLDNFVYDISRRRVIPLVYAGG